MDFFSKVSKGPNGCQIWTGALAGKGYGIFLPNGRRGKRYYAHRYSWEAVNGQIPEGMVICHRCDNPRCVNADHLFVGTQADNMRDMVEKGRSTSGEANPRAKLTKADVVAIRASDKSSREVAPLYGVSPGHIRSIRSGKKWGEAA